MELMAVAGARELKDGEVVFVGTGLPVVSALLAKLTHAPNLIMVIEVGSVDPEPAHTPLAVSDPRGWYRAVFHGSVRDVLGALLHRGLVDVGFIGGAQVDKFGNVNSTIIGDPRNPKVRLPGSGGACDIAALAKRTIISCRHELRRFPEKVDYITSPGYLDGVGARARAGLSGASGPAKVITDLCIMGFNTYYEMEIISLHPDVDLEEVERNTGFDIAISSPREIQRTPPPREDELKILRERIDPERVYIGE
jgi:acyl CoA:acetate/3-ketoacid CoA transferase beta subunit